jgi:solute carrier family 13 (sodium-dependent dicarboxylate transporter), member 2/3/5
MKGNAPRPEAGVEPEREGLSDGERRFDALRKRAGLLAGPLLFLGLLALPSSGSPAAHRLAAILALCIVFWITEALPLPATSLLGPSLAVVLGVADARAAFAPFADPVIFLFLGSFLLAEALHVHGLDKRMALAVLSLPQASRTPGRVQIALGLVTAAASMWISNTATAAMMLPLALGLSNALADAGAKPSRRGMLLTVAFSASIGGVATPVGTPPNLISLGFLERLGGVSIEFLPFMLMGVPLALGLLALQLLITRWMLPSRGESGQVASNVASERRALPPWGRGQWACAAAFFLAVALWLFPGLVAALHLAPGGRLARAAASFPEAVAALLAASLLFAWPVGGRRALSWEEGRRIDFGTLLLFGGGLSLGSLLFATKLAESWGRGLVHLTGVTSLWGLTAMAIAAAILLTELASNTAAATVLAPIVLALARDLGVPVVPPVLGVAFGSSMAFMLPISTPPNAIVYGSGQVPLPTMLRVGVVLDVLSFFMIFGTLRLLAAPLGWAPA